MGGGINICVSNAHTFGTDSFLLSYFANPKKYEIACDLCTGCGIIPLLWLRKELALKKAYAVDIQKAAYEQMLKSAEFSGLSDNFVPVHSDLKALDGLPFGEFHLVTCNPPYKAENTGIMSESESDRIARHETMCTIDDVCKAAKKLLRFGGRLCICQLPERIVDVLSVMRENNIEPKRIRFVQNKANTAPWLILVEGKLGAKPFLQIDKPLIMRKENGEMSEELQDIYSMYGPGRGENA